MQRLWHKLRLSIGIDCADLSAYFVEGDMELATPFKAFKLRKRV